MFSSTSNAEWTGVVKSGVTIFYVDFDRIRNNSGEIYYWRLNDYGFRTSEGNLSSKAYIQADCKVFKEKELNISFHEYKMGGGLGKNIESEGRWVYPAPDTPHETILQSVCDWLK